MSTVNPLLEETVLKGVKPAFNPYRTWPGPFTTVTTACCNDVCLLHTDAESQGERLMYNRGKKSLD